MEECSECKGAGFWWKQTCELEVGAKFSEPEKVICHKCNGSGKIQSENIDNELSHDQIIAVEKFAKDLRECYANYKKNHPDSLSDIMIDYAIQTVDLHLELAKIKFYRWGDNMAEAMGGGVKK